MTKPAGPSTEAPACESWCGAAACEFACVKRVPAPKPIERCSCAESLRLRAALEDVIAKCSGVVFGRHEVIERIARRALALEPEGTE